MQNYLPYVVNFKTDSSLNYSQVTVGLKVDNTNYTDSAHYYYLRIYGTRNSDISRLKLIRAFKNG